MPPRCSPPRSSISASTPFPRPSGTWPVPACRCGSILSLKHDLRWRAEMICQSGAKPMANFTLRDLEKRLQERAKASAHASYTRRLLHQGVAHCAKKLGEEAIETVLAAVEGGPAGLMAGRAGL